MKTVGNLIKEARQLRSYTRKDLEEITHIRANFIAAIENSRWKDLPEFNVTLGFVKSIAHFLDMSEEQAISTFRRDYPTKLRSSEEPALRQTSKEIGRRFIWGPRMTFLAGILIIIVVVLGYLGFQYRKFNSPPYLMVATPTQGQNVASSNLEVTGKTNMDANIQVNGQQVIVNSDGSFKTIIDVSGDTNEIVVVSKSRSGKETTIRRRINVHI